jgi:hypothetical protein
LLIDFGKENKEWREGLELTLTVVENVSVFIELVVGFQFLCKPRSNLVILCSMVRNLTAIWRRASLESSFKFAKGWWQAQNIMRF